MEYRPGARGKPLHVSLVPRGAAFFPRWPEPRRHGGCVIFAWARYDITWNYLCLPPTHPSYPSSPELRVRTSVKKDEGGSAHPLDRKPRAPFIHSPSINHVFFSRGIIQSPAPPPYYYYCMSCLHSGPAEKGNKKEPRRCRMSGTRPVLELL